MTVYVPQERISWWISILISLGITGAIIFAWVTPGPTLYPLAFKLLVTLSGLLGIFMVTAWSIWGNGIDEMLGLEDEFDFADYD